MIKRFAAAALTFAVALSTVTSAFAADKLQVVTMFGGSDAHAPALERLIKAFETSKKIPVENNSSQSSEAWKQSVLTDFNTGNEPHVLYYFNGADAEGILSKVVPVATIKAAYPDFAKDITAAAMSAIAEKSGAVYAVPFSGFWEGLFINKDMFDKARLPYPTNWDNFIRAIKHFSSSNIGRGTVPLTVGFADEPHYVIEHLILSAAGPAEREVKPGADLAKVPASWAKGLDMFKTLADMGAFGNMKAATTKKENAARNEFNQQRAAMMVNGSWFNGAVNNAKRGNFAQVFPFPKMPDGKGSGNDVIGGFSSGWYITKKAWDDPSTQKQAVEFVNYMSSKASIRAMLQPGSAPAANIAVSGGTLSTRSATEMVGKAESVLMPIDSYLKAAAWTEIWTNAANIANGKITGAQVLEKAIPLNK